MELALSCIPLALVGFVIGVLSGLLGIGGGTVIVPSLRLGFGTSAYMATGTSLFTIIPTSIAGAIAHVRNRTCIPRLGIVMGIGGALTSAVGVFLGSISPAWAVMLVAAIVIGYSAVTMLVKAVRLPHALSRTRRRSQESGGLQDGDGAPAGLDAGAGAVEREPFPHVSGGKLVAGFLVGVIAGLVSGYVGVGGGFIMVPLMTIWLGISMRHASGTSLIAVVILAVPGVVGQFALGHIDLLAGVLLAVGSIPGAVVGAQLVRRVRERPLRFLFAAFLGVAAVLLVVNELGMV